MAGIPQNPPVYVRRRSRLRRERAPCPVSIQPAAGVPGCNVAIIVGFGVVRQGGTNPCHHDTVGMSRSHFLDQTPPDDFVPSEAAVWHQQEFVGSNQSTYRSLLLGSHVKSHRPVNINIPTTIMRPGCHSGSNPSKKLAGMDSPGGTGGQPRMYHSRPRL